MSLAPFVYIDPQCGKPAFYLLRRPDIKVPAASKDIIDLKGNPIEPFSPMICGSCGEYLCPPQTINIKPVI
jgi:hypothetical protein